MGGLAVTGVYSDNRTLYNGVAVVAPPLANSGTYKRRIMGLSSGIKGQTTSQAIYSLAVKYSGSFDDPRYYTGDLPT